MNKNSGLEVSKAYYEKRYRPGDRGPSRRLPSTYQVFVDWLNINPGDKLLDVACGTGPLLQCAGTGVRSSGVDLSERAVSLARANAPWAQLIVGDMQHLPYPDGHFNCVATLGGLEHVPDMKRALREMLRVCANRGTLCIMVPNANFFWYRVSPLNGTQQMSMEEHLLTLTEWQALLRSAGLHILRIETDPGPRIRTNFGTRMFLRSVLRRIALSATKLMSITSTYQFVFICSKI